MRNRYLDDDDDDEDNNYMPGMTNPVKPT